MEFSKKSTKRWLNLVKLYMILQNQIPIVVVFFLIACSSGSIKDNKPKKLSNIPDSAFWCGGVDGGNWYYIHSIHPHRNMATISVYSDGDGSLIMKKQFMLICNTDKYTFINDLKKQINSFDGEKIYFQQSDTVNCWLQPRN